MTRIFLEKSYTTCGRETSCRPFSKKSKLYTFLDQQSKDLYSIFLLHDKNYRNILDLSCTPLAVTSYKAFLKNKKRSGAALPFSFSA